MSDHTLLDVLIVEDDRDLGGLLVLYLTTKGYTARAAPSAAEALRILTTGVRPRLIVTDLDMPAIDGHTFCTLLKKTPAYASIPCVIVTVHEINEDLAPSCGAIAAVRKPFHLPEILDIIRRYGGAPAGAGAADA